MRSRRALGPAPSALIWHVWGGFQPRISRALADMAEPVLGIAREGVNVGRSVLGVVDTANAGMSAAEKGIRGVKTAIAAGDIHQAAKTMRDTTKDAFAAAGSVRTQAKSTLQKARKP
eukprot:COSAG05_NODE_6134_length_1016_cov_6.480916_1_plen_117_part_00